MELLEEVLLRLPPAEPTLLVRVALVSKQWRGIVFDPHFHNLFREFHCTPFLLGLLYNTRDQDGDYIAHLVPTFPICPLHDDQLNWCALDARHGRVLLHRTIWGHDLIVWDPVTYIRCALPPVLANNVAVVCVAGDACNHIKCHGGPFIIVSLSTGPEKMWLRVYSSEDGSWGKPTCVALAPEYGVDRKPTTLMGNALYFPIDVTSSAMRYDLATGETSVMRLPPLSWAYATVLVMMEGGGLGVTRVDGAAAKLSLWSMEASPNGDIGWTEIRVVELGNLLPADALPIYVMFLGFAHGIGVFFVEADDRIFGIDLKSGQVEMVCEGNGYHGVVPYMSFYTPEL